MAESEQGLLLLEALSRGDVGIFLSGKPPSLFTNQNGVSNLLDVLRPHFGADLHLRQEEALLKYGSWQREDGESIGHSLFRCEALCDRVMQTGLPYPGKSLREAVRTTSLLADLRLSPEQ